MDAALIVALLAAVAGVAALRAGWNRTDRRVVIATGWAALAVSCACALWAGGAWGLSVASTAAMIAALAILSREGWRSAPARAAPAREPATVTLPHRITGVMRRVSVFLLVVPLGLVASALLAFGAQAMARRAGWAAADTVALMLMLMPLVWSILASIQLTRSHAARMVAPTLACAAAGLLLWWPL